MPGMFDYTLPTGETMSAPSGLFTEQEIAEMQARNAATPLGPPPPPAPPPPATRPAIPPWLGALGAPPPASGMMGQPRPVPQPPPIPQVPVATPSPAPAPPPRPDAGPAQVPGPPPPAPRRGGMGGTPSAPGGPPGWLTSEMQSRGEYEAPARPLSPLEQSRADQERGFDEQMRSVGDVARGRAEAAQLEAQALEQQNEMRRAQVQAAQAQQKEIEDRTGQLYQRAQDEVRAAGNLEVDVDRYWAQRGNFARAMGAIGIALGEQARIWGAPSNAAKEMIDDAIERDIAEQQMAIEQAQWRASAADNALARYAETYGSVPAAREAVKAAMYSQAEGEYRSALLARGVAEEQVMADATVRDLSGKRDEAIGAAREQMLLAQQMAAARAAAVKPKKPDLGTVINYGGEVRGVVKNAASAKPIQDKLNAAQTLQQHLTKLEELSGQWRVRGFNPQARAEFDAAAQDAGTAYKEMRQLGAMDQGTQELLERIMPSVNEFDWNNQARVKALRDAINRDVEVTLQNSVVNENTGRGILQPEPTVAGAEPVK